MPKISTAKGVDWPAWRMGSMIARSGRAPQEPVGSGPKRVLRSSTTHSWALRTTAASGHALPLVSSQIDKWGAVAGPA